jgi:hypothetical protein
MKSPGILKTPGLDISSGVVSNREWPSFLQAGNARPGDREFFKDHLFAGLLSAACRLRLDPAWGRFFASFPAALRTAKAPVLASLRGSQPRVGEHLFDGVARCVFPQHGLGRNATDRIGGEDDLATGLAGEGLECLARRGRPARSKLNLHSRLLPDSVSRPCEKISEASPRGSKGGGATRMQMGVSMVECGWAAYTKPDGAAFR